MLLFSSFSMRWAAAVGVLAALAGGALLWAAPQLPQRLLLLPMVGGLEPCWQAAPPVHCPGAQTPGAVVERTLRALGPATTADHAVGYTLHIPLLHLFVPDAAAPGGWRIDAAAVRRAVATMTEVQRPVLLYLFSTHFGVGAPLEAALAQDPQNLAATVDGPLPPDRYYSVPIHPWSVARTDNPLTARRAEAIAAVAEQVCALPREVRQRLVGTTVLGEVHQLFPDFSAGMGFERAYRITDYSEVSVRGFRQYLQQRFGRLEALNAALGADYARWEEVLPPGRDIRHDRLGRYHEHIDAHAHGVVPVSGWVHDPGQPRPVVRVWVNGREHGQAMSGLGRQDVAEALPELGTADVGWRLDLSVHDWPPGRYAIDVTLDRPGHAPLRIGTRELAVIDRAQGTPPPLPDFTPPQAEAGDARVRSALDTPAPGLAVFYNPLVPWWHAFRGQQVRDYLQHFARQVRGTCLGERPVYTHQIVPFTNPGWDATRFAIDASMLPGTGMALGVSLYGEAAMGGSFGAWLDRMRARPGAPGLPGFARRYGVTEFHPLRPLDGPQLAAVLRGHRAQGAEFVSFFLEPEGSTAPVANWASFDPRNPEYGSDRLYAAVQALLQPGNRVQPAYAGVRGLAVGGAKPLASGAVLPLERR